MVDVHIRLSGFCMAGDTRLHVRSVSASQNGDAMIHVARSIVAYPKNQGHTILSRSCAMPVARIANRDP